MEDRRLGLTWDDVLVLSGGMLIGSLLSLVLPLWLVALAPVWVIVVWLVWQIVRAVRDAA